MVAGCGGGVGERRPPAPALAPDGIHIGEDQDPTAVVVRLGCHEVTQGEVDRIDRLEPALDTRGAQERAIRHHLVGRLGSEAGVSRVDDATVNRALRHAFASQGVSEEDLRTSLAERDLSMSDYREELRQALYEYKVSRIVGERVDAPDLESLELRRAALLEERLTTLRMQLEALDTEVENGECVETTSTAPIR